jgi:hypothetical protein
MYGSVSTRPALSASRRSRAGLFAPEDHEGLPEGRMVEIKDVQMWWVAFVALVVEMGAALGPFLATGHGFGEMRHRRRQQERRGLPALPKLIEGPDGTWQVVH